MRININITPQNFMQYEEEARRAIGADIAAVEEQVRAGVAKFRESYASNITDDQLVDNIISSLNGKSLVEQHHCCLGYVIAMIESIPETDSESEFLAEAKEKLEFFRGTAEVLESVETSEYELLFGFDNVRDDISEMISLLTDGSVYTAIMFSQNSGYAELFEKFADASLEEIPALVAESDETVVRFGVTLYGLQRACILEAEHEFTAEEAGIMSAAGFTADEATKALDDPTPVFEKISKVLRAILPYAGIIVACAIIGFIIRVLIPALMIGALLAAAIYFGRNLEKIQPAAEYAWDKVKDFGLKAHSKTSEFVKSSHRTVTAWLNEKVFPAVRAAYTNCVDFINEHIAIPVTSFVLRARETASELWNKLVTNCRNAVDYIISEARIRNNARKANDVSYDETDEEFEEYYYESEADVLA